MQIQLQGIKVNPDLPESADILERQKVLRRLLYEVSEYLSRNTGLMPVTISYNDVDSNDLPGSGKAV